MAFSGNFMCTSFKIQLLQGKHDFTNGQDQFKLALYTNTAEPSQTGFNGSGSTMNHSIQNYSTSNEVTGAGYSAGGGTALRIQLLVLQVLELQQQLVLLLKHLVHLQLLKEVVLSITHRQQVAVVLQMMY